MGGVVALVVRLVILVILVRRDVGIEIREAVGQVAEDVGRVVELHQVVRCLEAAPLAVGVLRHDLAAEDAVPVQAQALVVIVDDDRVADPVGVRPDRVLELLEQGRLGLLAPFLEGQGEVVDEARR